jgi:hypothetical protein
LTANIANERRWEAGNFGGENAQETQKGETAFCLKREGAGREAKAQQTQTQTIV